MGFANQWIKLIMLCVTSVLYSILINGEPKGRIHPSRGIRQRDPLSPFLFLFYTKGLHGLISKEAYLGDIWGYSLPRNSPHLTHLPFANDSLLFCRATMQECQKILDILETCGNYSWQQINRSKTTIFFSKSTSEETRDHIKEELGVPKMRSIWGYHHRWGEIKRQA